MAIELDKLGYAGIGLLAKMQDLIEDFVEGREKEETADTDESRDIKEKIDQLASAGEERYDEWLEKSKEEREKISEKVKERAAKVFSELGFVTKEDIEDLEAKLAKLQQALKKAVAKDKE